MLGEQGEVARRGVCQGLDQTQSKRWVRLAGSKGEGYPFSSAKLLDQLTLPHGTASSEVYL